ncbi:MAG: HEAT repeat domain-containing protein [Opitutales bacterium]|nr:HEAT repeat domain-containing protein [Opitutales bacterium]
MKFATISIASIVALSALSAFAWDNMPNIVANATKQVEEMSPAEVIKYSLEAVGTGVQDPNLDRNKNFEQQENAFIKTWTATEASFYYGNPKMDKGKRAEFVKAVCSAYKNAKTKEQKIFLLGLLQNCPDESSVETLKTAMADKDRDIADAARMALQQSNAAQADITIAKAKPVNKDIAKDGAIVNALATRAYDGKRVHKVVKEAQNSDANKNMPYEKALKNRKYAAALIAGRNWYQKGGIEEFSKGFFAKPDKSVARKAIESGNDREFIAVFPYAFGEFADLQGIAKARYEKADPALKAWLLTAIGYKPTAAGRDFVIASLKNAKEEEVRLGGAWALADIGDEPCAFAAIDLHKAAWKDDQNNVRTLTEYAVGAMKPSKAFDKAILDGVKAYDRTCIRLAAARGLFEALPSIMQAIKENKERGDASWAFRQLGSMDDIFKIVAIAIDQNDNWLCREVFQITTEMSRGFTDDDVAKFKAEVAKWQPKAEAKGVNIPWDRMLEMAQYKGRPPKKR